MHREGHFIHEMNVLVNKEGNIVHEVQAPEIRVPGSYPSYAKSLKEECLKHGEVYILESDLASEFWQTKRDIDAARWLKKGYGLDYKITMVNGFKHYIFKIKKKKDSFPNKMDLVVYIVLMAVAIAIRAFR